MIHINEPWQKEMEQMKDSAKMVAAQRPNVTERGARLIGYLEGHHYVTV